NGVAERRNMTLIEAARTMLADSKLPTTFWAEAVSTACYVQNRVLVVKPHNKIPYELFRGLKPALNFKRPFGCRVNILNTLDNLGKFDGKSDKGTITNEFAGKQEEFNAYTSTQKEEISQDCIVEDGPDNENVEKDKSKDDSSPKEVNTARQHVNTASPEVNIGSFKLNTVDPSVCTASLNDTDSPKDMFKMGASHTLEATHVEFFSDEDEPEVDLEKPLVKDGDADDVDVKHIEYLMLSASPLKHVKRGRDTKIPQSSDPPIKVGDEVVHKELGDIMERAATTASSLESEQDSGNINKTQSMATLNGSSH
ncbi:putative ribonuclease H-like domain-containing protein, partial [Tanacetum coccineum]